MKSQNSLASHLESAIRTLESVSKGLVRGDEICISDIDATVQELRGALYDATNGQAQIFREEGTDRQWFTVDLFQSRFEFFWPCTCDSIQSFFVKDGKVWASSSEYRDLHNEPNRPVISQDPDASFIEIGHDDGFFGGHYWAIRAKKTNLRNCANPYKEAV